MRSFAGIPERYTQFDSARILLQPIPYDGTSTWGKGADRGFEAFMAASENMELYDIETDSEVYRQGIHTLPPISAESADELCLSVRAQTERMLASGKFPTFIGGEHSVSIGIIQAFAERWPDITVLQLDAHADLRPEYLGSACNHACALHWASQHTRLIQVGVRSMDRSEKSFLNPDRIFYADETCSQSSWMDRAIGLMGPRVYISIDLDVFDPSIMPATGTPEPGGLDWYTVIRFLKKVFENREVLGFDLVELAPIEGLPAPDFLAAKLYYKLLSYRFGKDEKV